MRRLLLPFACLLAGGCSQPHLSKSSEQDFKSPKEPHLMNVRQLTTGGTNSRAHWSYDDDWLSFQHQGLGLLNDNPQCEQVYKIRKDGTETQRLSNGLGLAVDSYFLPNGKRVLFSSTFATEPKCPPDPPRNLGWVWPIHDSFQIYGVRPDGTDTIPLEPGAPRAYNAETTTCSNGSVIFTSDRTGDLELFSATLDSFGTFKDIKQLSQAPGYDGGASFSPDCKKLVWFASRPKKGKELAEYQKLLAKHLVKPTKLEIWMANADGSQARPITHFGATSFAPAFTPDGNKILFTSNLRNPQTRRFSLYLVDLNGDHLEQVTASETIDSFAAFSRDGENLVFTSTRNAKTLGEINLFISEWTSKTE